MTSPLSVAADALVAEADSTDPDAIRMMARKMAHTYGCTYSAGKGAIVRAIKRANGQASTWGGKRQPQGGRPKAEVEVSNYQIVIKNGAPTTLHEMINGMSTMNRNNAYTVETTPEHIARLNTKHGKWLTITVMDGAGRPKAEQDVTPDA